MDVAIVGSGISGLSAAYALHPDHQVTVFEAGPAAGGHVKTVTVDGPDGPVEVDTGFIVYNERTYPRVRAAARRAGRRRRRPSDMSFGSACTAAAWRTARAAPAGFFPDARTAAPPRPLADAGRRPALLPRGAPRPRGRRAGHARRSASGSTSAATAGRSATHFLVPVASAVWSTAADRIHEFPVAYLLRFLDNHGLIGSATPRSGASSAAARGPTSSASSRRCRAGAVRTGVPVLDVARDPFGVTVTTARRGRERFDAVDHRDPRRRRPAAARRRRRPRATRARRLRVLDQRRRPAHGRARSCRPTRAPARRGTSAPPTAAGPAGALTMTYHMNRLQSLPGDVDYCVSVNPGDAVRAERVIVERAFAHPLYTFRTLAAQAGVADLQGRNRTWYAGAHLGYGFHEDGCRSGLRGGRRSSAPRRAQAAA